MKPIEQHLKELKELQSTIETAYASRIQLMRSRAPGSISHRIHRPVNLRNTLPMDNLNQILGWEGDGVWTEPNVTMDTLTNWSLRQGFIPRVVAEFRNITVGGAIVGATLESSSFREGQFSDTCTDYVVLLPDGKKIRTSPELNADLHNALPGSYGTLGTVVAARVKLLPTQAQYVQLKYHPIGSYEEIVPRIAELCTSAQPPDYLDGVLLSPKSGLLVEGRLVNAAESAPLQFLRPWDPWFIQHLVEIKNASSPQTSYVLLKDYLFRYDRAAFWMGQFCTPLPALWRFLSSWHLEDPQMADKMHELYRQHPPSLSPSLLKRLIHGGRISSVSLYSTLHRIPKRTLEQLFIIQDFYIPADRLTTFLSYLTEQVGIFPLWLCPVKGAQGQFLSPNYLDRPAGATPDFINVGVYGIPAHRQSIPTTLKEMEQKTYELGGRKMLYSLNSLSSELFWKHYDRVHYDELRQQVAATDLLPDLYQKTHT